MTNTLRILEIRRAKGLKAVELAEAAGISAPFLSQVERGIVDPSLETLRQIARVLEVPLFGLFNQDPDDHTAGVIRKGEETTITSPGGGLTYARKSLTGMQLEVLSAVMRPGSVSRDELWSHESEECVVVTTGTLEIETSKGVHTLNAGDACHYDSRLPHRFVNRTDEPVEFLISITPPSY